ncbi:MAG: 3-keto-5-aminohexanoate cleavage protein [Deltaproteobacteria bacterium]|nr:3-keto-5-aminohexanoate cleavage protein [Deltaproteobacteria bacterium]
MSNAVGLAVTLRVRFGPSSADRVGGLVDPARIAALFSDVASELMIRLDGDEGVLRGYERLEILAPVFAGDYVEAIGVLTRVSNTSRQIAFEARKVISAVRAGSSTAPTAADALAEPIVVCRAVGTCIVPRALQRHPRLVVPALPQTSGDGARLPEGHVIVTPPPHIVVTPPRSTPPEIILAASIVGGGVTRDHTPHIPITPEEIAAEARRCRDAGAGVVHIGLEPTGSPEELSAKARSIVDAVRASCDALIFLSTMSPGAEATELRAAIAEAGADVIGFATGSSNFGDGWIENPRGRMRQTASMLRERNARVICECLELGHIDEAVALAREKFVAHPLRLQVVLGVPGALGANDDVVRFLASRIPRGAVWFAAGVGRHQRPVTEAAARCGGNVRVGLADNIYMKRGVLAEGSAPFVDRAATFARSIGRDPIDPARARALLRLDATEAAASPAAAEQTEQAPAEPEPPDDKTVPSS